MPRASCPLPPSEYSPVERVFTAARHGIEPYASRLDEAREQQMAEALAARSIDGIFRQVVFERRWRGDFDPRLVEKFLSFPLRMRERDASLLFALSFDPRVRREIARIGPRLRKSLFKGFGHWLGLIGGPDARAVLEKRVRELKRALKGSRRVRQESLDVYASACGSLVFLDPDSSLGADGLLEMFATRSERLVSINTIDFLRECVLHHPYSGTTPMLRIRRALRELLDPRTSIDDFDCAAPALIEIDREKTLARIDEILESEPKHTPFICLQTAAQYGSPPHAALARFLARRVTTWNAADIALKIGESLTVATRTTIAENALKQRDVRSRFSAALLLRATPGTAARTLARRFARTERDELVRLVLTQRAAHR